MLNLVYFCLFFMLIFGWFYILRGISKNSRNGIN